MRPTHMPFFLEAAILSLMRSAVTSLSNCAKDKSKLSFNRPMDEELLKNGVIETKEQPLESRQSMGFAKSDKDRVSISIL